jgi:vanillate O-demethylase monooxygenase subunit
MFLENTHPAFRPFWHPVAARDEVTTAPLKVKLGGESWVLWRGSNGAVRALGDRCPHREAPLSLGVCRDDVLQCRYHGWEFNADGRCLNVPAVAPGTPLPDRFNAQTPFAVHEGYGLVWIAPSEPRFGVPELPELDGPFPFVRSLTPRRVACSAAQLAENFVDLAHFPFLHAATFADPDPVMIPLLEMDVSPSGFRWEFHDKWRIAETGAFEPVVTEFFYAAPYWIRAVINYESSGACESIVTVMQPETVDSTRLYVIVLHNGAGWSDAGEFDERVKFWDQVMAEDCWLLEAMERKGLELSLTEKASSSADRSSVELHRALAAIARSA